MAREVRNLNTEKHLPGSLNKTSLRNRNHGCDGVTALRNRSAVGEVVDLIPTAQTLRILPAKGKSQEMSRRLEKIPKN